MRRSNLLVIAYGGIYKAENPGMELLLSMASNSELAIMLSPVLLIVSMAFIQSRRTDNYIGPTTRSRKGKTNDINRQSDNGASFALRGIGSQDLLWFGRISYLFENELLEKCFHIRWFHHGFDTMIREFSGPNELFLSSLCDDNPLQCINGKIQVDFVDHAREDPDSSVIETKFTAMNHFFYRFHYDSDKKLFSDARSQEPQDSIRRDYRPPVYHCDCCILKSEEDRKHQIKIISTSADGSVTGIEFEGIKYYLDDFIYMVHGVGTLAQIGQILGIRVLNCASTHSTYMDEVNVKIKVRGFDRTYC